MVTDDMFDADAWRGVIAEDSSYRSQVVPLLVSLLEAQPGDKLVDLGCGEGQGMRALGDTESTVIGCDLSFGLLGLAREAGPVVQARLPRLEWLRDGAVTGAFAMLVLEHLGDPGDLFTESYRVVEGGGRLIVVGNHPLMTAPGSAPIIDPEDGEVLWRWGRYLQGGHTDEPQGDGVVRFYHHGLAGLLNMAADAGWALERLVEEPLRSDDPLLALQAEIPRLIGIRWAKPAAS